MVHPLVNQYADVMYSGIISDPEQTIYPSQYADDSDTQYHKLPSECEACKFTSETSHIEIWPLEIPIGVILDQKPKEFSATPRTPHIKW